jgi:hypothetical protein
MRWILGTTLVFDLTMFLVVLYVTRGYAKPERQTRLWRRVEGALRPHVDQVNRKAAERALAKMSRRRRYP